MNWFNQAGNSYQVKKAIFNLVPEKYHKNEAIIERLGALLITDSDVKSFFSLLADVYETGYLKSVNDHKEQLNKIGLKARIVAQDSKDG